MQGSMRAKAWLVATMFSVTWATALAAPTSARSTPTVTVVLGGDFEWGGRARNPAREKVFYDDAGKPLLEGGWQPVPHLLTSEKVARLKATRDPMWGRIVTKTEQTEGDTYERISAYWEKTTNYYPNRFDSPAERDIYPWKIIAPLFQKADIAFLNVETPISDRAYRVGHFMNPTHVVDGLKYAGLDVVSVANNHMLDAERQGLFDTLDTLRDAGIESVGAGRDLSDARRPVILVRNGIKIAFLAYTQLENSGPLGFANFERAGVMPLDPDLIREDIAAVRSKVDFVVLSFHWDIYSYNTERQHELHPGAVEFAHAMIDAGADAIIGHDSHVARPVELYKGKPIYYGVGNLIFGFTVPAWDDNIIARLVLSKSGIERAEVIPIAGRGAEIAQPFQLEGDRAKEFMDKLRVASRDLGTDIMMEGDVGILTRQSASRP